MIDDKAQGGSMLLFLLLFVILIFVIMPMFGQTLGIYVGYALAPLIGFNGEFPLLTIFCAGLIVVIFSSLLTNLFTDWMAMGKSQEVTKAFQKEMTKARREGNTNRIAKLLKMQQDILRQQTRSQMGMMKSMLFLIIFIWPIFLWLQNFLKVLPYYYLTVPWANTISFFDKSVLWQVWLWFYLIISIVFGQIVRQGLKWISWSTWWQTLRGKVKPSSQ